MNSAQIAQLQKTLGLPATGVLDTATYNAMNSAVTKSLSSNSDVQQYSGGTSPDDILKAYTTGDWSGVTGLDGKPFTDEQQQAAVSAASSALAPGYNATAAYDKAGVESTFANRARDYALSQKNDAAAFKVDKDTLDQTSANNGVLYSGARVQKQNQLAATYGNRDAAARATAADADQSAARNYAYQYGSPAASDLKSLYSLPGSPTFNAGVARGNVTPNSTLSAVYNPSEYGYQGTKPIAQNVAVQTRAAGLLGNRANKLSLNGYATKY